MDLQTALNLPTFLLLSGTLLVLLGFFFIISEGEKLKFGPLVIKIPKDSSAVRIIRVILLAWGTISLVAGIIVYIIFPRDVIPLPSTGPIATATQKSTNTPTLTNTSTITPTITNKPIPTNTVTPINTLTPTQTQMIALTLEDFENEMRMDWWSPDPDVFSYSVTDMKALNSSFSLMVDYKKDDTHQFIGAELPSELRDISWAKTLVVWVYGQTNLLLKLEYEDENDEIAGSADVKTLEATNPNGWNELRFDISQLTNEVDLTHIKTLLFFPEPGNNSAQGIIYIDEITLSMEP
jgi:hypothetical protein